MSSQPLNNRNMVEVVPVGAIRSTIYDATPRLLEPYSPSSIVLPPGRYLLVPLQPAAPLANHSYPATANGANARQRQQGMAGWNASPGNMQAFPTANDQSRQPQIPFRQVILEDGQFTARCFKKRYTYSFSGEGLFSFDDYGKVNPFRFYPSKISKPQKRIEGRGRYSCELPDTFGFMGHNGVNIAFYANTSKISPRRLFMYNIKRTSNM